MKILMGVAFILGLTVVGPELTEPQAMESPTPAVGEWKNFGSGYANCRGPHCLGEVNMISTSGYDPDLLKMVVQDGNANVATAIQWEFRCHNERETWFGPRGGTHADPPWALIADPPADMDRCWILCVVRHSTTVGRDGSLRCSQQAVY